MWAISSSQVPKRSNAKVEAILLVYFPGKHSVYQYDKLETLFWSEAKRTFRDVDVEVRVHARCDLAGLKISKLKVIARYCCRHFLPCEWDWSRKILPLTLRAPLRRAS